MKSFRMDTEVAEINKQLKEHFGISTDTSQPMWRVVWAADEREMVRTEFTDSGLQLLHPEVREMPKYMQWITDRYVLEHLVAVPEVNLVDLPAVKMSYEPIHTFENQHGFLPPTFRVCKLIVDVVNAAMNRGSLKKYVEFDGEDGTNESFIRKRAKDIAEIELELFGEQSSLEGSTKTGESVAYTGPSFQSENN